MICISKFINIEKNYDTFNFPSKEVIDNFLHDFGFREEVEKYYGKVFYQLKDEQIKWWFWTKFNSNGDMIKNIVYFYAKQDKNFISMIEKRYEEYKNNFVLEDIEYLKEIPHVIFYEDKIEGVI